MKQQKQTRQYFQSVADDWQNQSVNLDGTYSVIDGRNSVVLEAVDAADTVSRFLDVGCGTGQLVIDVAKRDIEAEGIDFADEMIIKCEENKKAAGVSANFIKGSFFDVALNENSYDVISAQGLIEYLSPEEMTALFNRCFKLLRAKGSLVVGSRNRLFNAVSLNEYTLLEADFGTLDVLIRESVALQTSTSQEEAFEALRQFERIDPQPKVHPITRIAVDTRYQYTPADLIYRLRGCQFKPKTIFPVNYHGLSPSIKEDQPELFSQLAQNVASFGVRDQRLVPFSSTFVLELQKDA
jgi:2-polyprenyl-3-methyl-5-hydroxy-6-metoxy-1,4-benzoquinol methylase